MNNYLNKETVRLNLKGSTKEQILSELVDVLVQNGIIPNSQPLLDALLEREGLGSTGIGYGVAIPHGRCQDVSRPAVILGRTENEVDFDSIDGQPARIFFLLVAPEDGNTEHLHLLAGIARMMKDADIRNKLLKLETAEEVVALFAEEPGS